MTVVSLLPGLPHDSVHHSLLSSVSSSSWFSVDVIEKSLGQVGCFSTFVVDVSFLTKRRYGILLVFFLLGPMTSSLGLFSIYVIFSCVVFFTSSSRYT